MIDLTNSIVVIVLFFVFRFAICLEYATFFIYFNELYPTQVRVLGTSLVSSIGGIMAIIAPLLLEYCFQVGFPVMVIFTFMSVFCLYYSKQLP